MSNPSLSVLQVKIILAPLDASNLEASAPIPLPPPVTIYVLFLRLLIDFPNNG